jgi:hypothetical protein
MEVYEIVKYKNTFGIYCNNTRNFLVFGKKKDLLKILKELNESEKQKPTPKIEIDWFYE